MVVELSRAEVEALLWLEQVVGHSYGRDRHPDMGASASAAEREKERALGEERRAA